MSVELAEAKILADQMSKELKGKCVKSCILQNYERLQKIGMLNEDLTSFDKLVDGNFESAVSRGNVIRVKFDNGMNLIIGPEYGGAIFYHADEKVVPKKFHLKV